MHLRLRLALALVCLAAVSGLAVPPAQARATAVARVSGLGYGGSNAATGKLVVRWTRVTGATYQVRWAYATSRLGAARLYPSRTNAATSPVLSNICITWYAQVRAVKSGRVGAWSTAKALKFSIPTIKVPAPVTTGQTSTSQAQVRWTRAAGAAGYRLDWSPAPFGNWIGLEHLYTPYVGPTATGTSVPMKPLGAGDHFLGAAYGNPVFAQLQVKRCSGSTIHSPYFPVYPKSYPAGDATTGDALRFGSYNVELTPQAGNPAIAALASNIAAADLEVVALQEANAGTASALIDQLGTAENQADWEAYGQGQQQVMYRTSRWLKKSQGIDVGQAVDGTAATPLPSPGILLKPADGDPSRADIFVASIHLEDRKKFDQGATIAEQKRDAHASAEALISAIGDHNAGAVTLVAGDFKGNFGGGGQAATAGYCDETSRPVCVAEGQPTFIRAGYLDARGAANRVGAQYGTVNGHVSPQAAANSGVGNRADFIVGSGFTGFSRYTNRANKTYSGLVTTDHGTPSDHNLIVADLFVPHAVQP